MAPLHFQPPLLNSSSPWATTEEDLYSLYNCTSTGATTVRTSLIKGFDHDPTIHQYAYFDIRSCAVKHVRSPNANATLNTLGYSPITLGEYLTMIEKIVARSPRPRKVSKPFIVSVTGSPDEIVESHRLILSCASKLPIPLYMEINLSCPNIPNKPPPAYSGLMLQEYLFALQKAFLDRNASTIKVPVGIKTPPYTYHDQFAGLIDALLASARNGIPCPIEFITSTNTLGSCLVLAELDDVMAPKAEMTSYVPAVGSGGGSGIGGVGGAVIHPISLGNVRTIRSMLDRHDTLRDIEIIGVGGVADYAAFARMKSCGAAAVGLASALGKEGLDVFEKIMNEYKTLETFGKYAFGQEAKHGMTNGLVNGEAAAQAEQLKNLSLNE